MIHVCYNVNAGIFRGLLMSVMSVAKHTPSPVTFHILTMDMTEADPKYAPVNEDQLGLINKVIGNYNSLSHAELVDCKPLYEKYFSGNKNSASFYTPYAMLRLFVDELALEGNPDKIIYLDADTMCLKDIRELWDINISRYEFGAALDAAGKLWIRSDYCNSGVMLINLPKVRKTKLLARVRDRVASKLMFMPDQSALNDFVWDKLVLPRKFNEQRSVKSDTVIKHFCRALKFFPYPRIEGPKQWEKEKVHNILRIHSFDDIFDEIEELEKDFDI